MHPFLESQDGLGKFRLAVALDSRDGQDLAAGNVEADAVNDVLAVRGDDGEVLDLEGRLLRLGGGLVQGQVDGPAHHHGGQLRGGGAGLAEPTTLPRRITVMVSETAFTSRSLCEMNTMEVPLALELAHDVQQFVGFLRASARRWVHPGSAPWRPGPGP